jgi:hypothetical protein
MKMKQSIAAGSLLVSIANPRSGGGKFQATVLSRIVTLNFL